MDDQDAIFNQLHEEMTVIGNDGEEVGKIKEIFTDSFRVDRRLQLDVTLSFETIETIIEDAVMLNIPAWGVGDTIDDDIPATRPPHAP